MDAIKALAKATVSKDAVVKKEDDKPGNSQKFVKSSSSSNTFKPVLPMMLPPRLNIIGSMKSQKNVETVKSHHFDWDLEDTDEAIRIDFSKVSSNSRKRKTSEMTADPVNFGPQLPQIDKKINSESETANSDKNRKSSKSEASKLEGSKAKSSASTSSELKSSLPKSSPPKVSLPKTSPPKPSASKSERPDHDPADMERLKIKTYEERKARLESSKRYSQRTIRDEKLSFGIEENWKNVFFRNLSPNFSQSDLKKLALDSEM